MSDDVELLIRRIKVRIRAEDPTVIEDAVRLTEQYPEESDAWKVLAYAHAKANKYSAAIAALSRAIEVNPQGLALFFERGQKELTMGNYERAVADFSQGLVLCAELSADCCRTGPHFLRAEALVQVGKKVEALADLAHVPEDYEFWTIELRSKADLLALCADVSSPGQDGRYQGPKDPPDEDESVDEWQLPDTPDADETALADNLGADGLAKADATLLKWVRPQWHKVARVLCDTIETDDFAITDTLVRVYLRRLIALVDGGAIESAGNVRRPRFSEVRLPKRG